VVRSMRSSIDQGIRSKDLRRSTTVRSTMKTTRMLMSLLRRRGLERLTTLGEVAGTCQHSGMEVDEVKMEADEVDGDGGSQGRRR